MKSTDFYLVPADKAERYDDLDGIRRALSSKAAGEHSEYRVIEGRALTPTTRMDFVPDGERPAATKREPVDKTEREAIDGKVLAFLRTLAPQAVAGVAQIAAGTGLDGAAVNPSLARLVKAGTVAKPGHNKYRAKVADTAAQS